MNSASLEEAYGKQLSELSKQTIGYDILGCADPLYMMLAHSDAAVRSPMCGAR